MEFLHHTPSLHDVMGYSPKYITVYYELQFGSVDYWASEIILE